MKAVETHRRCGKGRGRAAMIPRLNVKNGISISLNLGVFLMEFKKARSGPIPTTARGG